MHLILNGEIEGKRRPGRRKTSWLADMRKWYGCTTAELKEAATSKEKIAEMIAQLRTEMAD